MKIIEKAMWSLLTVCVALSLGWSQSEDPVLFSIDDNDVRVSEFRYIYEKNNAQEADYSQESLEEYYELYKNFKLKVIKAQDLGIDTLPNLQQELAGYRKQLAAAYMIDKQAEKDLIREVYDRMQHDVEIAHILIRYPKNRNSGEIKDETMARAGEAYQQLKNGTAWNEVVEAMSGDQQSNKNAGYLGWFTAMFPSGFYELETAAYNTEVGGFSAPVESSLGLHIVKVLDKREARGKILTAQIFLSKKRHGQDSAKAISQRVYSLLEEGKDFEELVSQYSDDSKTKNKGGVMGYVGIRKYEKSFEDALFSLEKDGDYSQPVESAVGYHIIKRLSKQDYTDVEVVSRNVRPQVLKDSRSQDAKNKMIQSLKEKSDFARNEATLDAYRQGINDQFFVYNWEPPMKGDKPVMTLLELPDEMGNRQEVTYTLDDLNEYLKSDVRTRLQGRNSKSPTSLLDEMLTKYEEQLMNDFQERNLEATYPEFKALMREYEEGIVLFEITKDKIWDKASQDTAGLKKFFNRNRDNYTWEKRARVHEYKLSENNPKLAKKLRKLTSKKDHDDITSKLEKHQDLLKHSLRIVQLSELPEAMPKENNATSVILDREEGGVHWFKIDQMLPAALKSFDDSKGFVIADYQKELEAQWLEELNEEYEVTLDNKVFQSLIKK